MASAATPSDASHPLVSLFGPEIQSKSGPVPSESLASRELIGIYFSAHWCPPCKAFTPRLVECYNKVNAEGQRFEIIFVSSDQEQEQFDEYYGEMPWPTLGFQSELNDALNSKYKIQGIPTLVFIDPQTGQTITKDGRSSVSADLDGNDFPWTPPSFWEMMAGAEIIGKTEEEKRTGEQLREELAGGYLGIYFSGHWCGPCKAFTPHLSQWYTDKKDTFGAPFEIVFASSDRDEAAFDSYYAEMPWKALSYADRTLKEKLSAAFGVRGIPTFAIVEVDTGKTVTTGGRAGLAADPDGFPWAKKAFGILSGLFLDNIQDTPFLLLFGEDDGSSQVNLLERHGVEEAEKAKATGEDFGMIYCTVPKEMELRGRLREIMKLDEGATKLVVLDLSKGCFFVADVTDANAIDQATVDAFVLGVRDGSIQEVKLITAGHE